MADILTEDEINALLEITKVTEEDLEDLKNKMKYCKDYYIKKYGCNKITEIVDNILINAKTLEELHLIVSAVDYKISEINFKYDR